jgi:hypothetical protein
MRKFKIVADIVFAFGSRRRKGEIVEGDQWAKLGSDVVEVEESAPTMTYGTLLPTDLTPNMTAGEMTEKVEASGVEEEPVETAAVTVSETAPVDDAPPAVEPAEETPKIESKKKTRKK